MYSDASNSACGALIKGNQSFVSHKMFSDSEKTLSSTHCDLIAILYSLEAFGEKLHNSSVKWFTDNQATAHIVDIGSMKLALHQLAFDIFSYCMSNNIDLHVQWIPREFNSKQMQLASLRTVMIGNYHTSFFWCWKANGVLIHLTALRRFITLKHYSRFWNPGTSGMDAFYQSREGENCLVVPAVSIIPKVNNVCATAVIPAWPSAIFWPLLWQRHYKCISEYFYFKGNEACIHGRNSKSTIGSSSWDGYIVALRMNTMNHAL